MARAVKQASIELLTEHGTRPVAGYKVSLSTGSWGALTDDVVLQGPASLARSRAIDPLLEGELVFVADAELTSANSVDDIVRSCRVAPGIEIADSRWEGWLPSAPDRFVVPNGSEIEADNAVSGWLVLGDPWRPAHDLALEERQISIHTSGVRIAGDALSKVMGHPAEAVRWLLQQLSESGRSLQVGQLVSSGCPWAELVTVPAGGGAWEVEVDGIGTAQLAVT
jgi:2-oxo-hept-3-ene-1,7-dioate hydratase